MSAKTAKPKIGPAEKMIAGKERLISKLTKDIAAVRRRAEDEVGKITTRIKVAETIISALKKGTLKP